MDNLHIYLSPFSPDYSGITSVLYDFNAITVLHDASGCTGNYTGYDEPRWQANQKNTYCSGLRELDAVLGDDEKLINKVYSAIESLNPELTAIIGTPVPMVIGTDTRGIAKEIETVTGVLSMGFDTTGTKYYDVGISMVMKELIERFANKDVETIHNSVNILGADAIDFPNFNNIKDMINFLENNGYSVLSCGVEKMSLEIVKGMLAASCNIVVSKSGLDIAKYLYSKYNIPYICYVPLGKKAKDLFIESVKDSITNKENIIIVDNKAKDDLHICKCEQCNCHSEGEVLILGEQVLSNSIRVMLKQEYGINSVVGSIFKQDKSIATDYDLDLTNEIKIMKAINSGFKTIIGDPMFKLLVKNDDITFLELPNYAVSSKASKAPYIDFMFNKFNCFTEGYFSE